MTQCVFSREVNAVHGDMKRCAIAIASSCIIRNHNFRLEKNEKRTREKYPFTVWISKKETTNRQMSQGKWPSVGLFGETVCECKRYVPIFIFLLILGVVYEYSICVCAVCAKSFRYLCKSHQFYEPNTIDNRPYVMHSAYTHTHTHRTTQTRRLPSFKLSRIRMGKRKEWKLRNGSTVTCDKSNSCQSTRQRNKKSIQFDG